MDSCHKQEDNSLPRLNTIMTQTQNRDFQIFLQLKFPQGLHITQPYSKQDLKKMITMNDIYSHFINILIIILCILGLLDNF